MRTSIQRAYGVRSFLLSHFYTIVTQRPHACSTTLFFDLLPPFDPSRSRRGAERHVADTGIRIDLDWNRLTLSQRGADTDRIDALYKIHYLQWTGMKSVDQVLGALGILLVVALSVLGVRLFFAK